jgi:hypothetical protein
MIMRTTTTLAVAFLTMLLPTQNASAQCAEDENIYLFNYNGKSYEIIKENKTWTEAAACAASRGGYLAEINNAEEQEAIFTQLANADITPADTEAGDGFGSYIWLGGNDITTEGFWALNGNNDEQAVFFWQGSAGGAPMNNRFNNWGNNEPDNWGDAPGQDALAMAIIPFPNGEAGKWNDVSHTNELFFIVEHNSLLNTPQADFESEMVLYPNPATDFVNITNADNLTKAVIVSVTGHEVISLQKEELGTGQINIANLPAGVYFINLKLENNITLHKRLVKKQ